MSNILSEQVKILTVLAPAADRYNGNPASDIVSTAAYGLVTFVVSEGAGGTGTVKIQVEACSDNAGTDNTAIAFKYRTTAADGNTVGTLTASAAAGYTTTAGADKQVIVEVPAESVTDAKPWVRLQLTEVVDDPCAAGVIAICSKGRFREAAMPSAV